MKPIEQLSEATLKHRLKALYALDQFTLSREQITARNQIENRLYELHLEKHPPIHTPKGFVNDIEGDW